MMLRGSGRLPEAINQFKQALQLKPDAHDVHNVLGNALVEAGETQEAIWHYEQALRIKPDYFEAHNNLGNALVQVGKAKEAIVHYEQALRIKPDHAEAQNHIGNILLRLGRVQEAIAHYEQALRIKPEYIQAQNSLAWILATDGDDQLRKPQTAVQLAEHACSLTQRRDPNLLDTLAAAYAATGRFADAIPTAQEAHSLAAATGQEA